MGTQKIKQMTVAILVTILWATLILFQSIAVCECYNLWFTDKMININKPGGRLLFSLLLLGMIYVVSYAMWFLHKTGGGIIREAKDF